MKEVYVLHHKITGAIVGAGRVDRELDETRRDGSTPLEYIERKIGEDINIDVSYFPVTTVLPDILTQKMSNGKIVDIPKQEIDKKNQKEKLISARMRKIAEDQLRVEGKIE